MGLGITFGRLLRQFRLGLTLLAALGTAVLPVLVHAHMNGAGSAPPGWVEVCTSQGMQWVAPESVDARSTPYAPAQHDHGCLCCHTITPALGMPTPGLQTVSVATASHRPDPVIAQWPVSRVIWTRPQGRAPPAA